jgi:hypothetical protein
MEKIAVGAFSFLIGVVGIWTGFIQLRNRRGLNLWPATKGRVIERGAYIPTGTAASGAAFRYAPLVRYAYQVGGREFVNDCINPKRIQLPTHNTKQWAQKRAASFADEVTVYYNPADPNESFLVQTPKIMLYLIIVGSCLALLFGVLFCAPK